MVRRILFFFFGSAIRRETEVLWVVYCCGRAIHVTIPGMYWTELLDLTSSPTQYILSAAQFDEKVDGWPRTFICCDHLLELFSCWILKDPISKDEEFRLYRLVTLLLDILHHLEADIEIGFPRRWCGVRSDFGRTFLFVLVSFFRPLLTSLFQYLLEASIQRNKSLKRIIGGRKTPELMQR